MKTILYRHYHNGKLYRIIAEGNVFTQVDDQWVPAVIYEVANNSDGKVFTREASEFHAKFRKELIQID